MFSPDALIFNPSGWVKGVTHTPSPNFNARPPNTKIDLLVIHNISLPPGQYGGNEISHLFCNTLNYEAHPYFEHLRNLTVSAHFLISRQGDITQFVSVYDRAWHAGTSTFQGKSQCNDFSVGVELEGADFEIFTPEQYIALIQLSYLLQKNLPLQYVCGHEHIAPDRKTDPGPFFDWRQYQTQLLEKYPKTCAPTPLLFPQI